MLLAYTELVNAPATAAATPVNAAPASPLVALMLAGRVLLWINPTSAADSPFVPAFTAFVAPLSAQFVSAGVSAAACAFVPPVRSP